MRKADVSTGKTYIAKISGKLTQVKLGVETVPQAETRSAEVGA